MLEIRTESQDVLDAMTALSKLHQQNTVASRRQLRARIEQRGVTTVEHFLSAAQGVIQVLQLCSYGLLACSCAANSSGLQWCLQAASDASLSSPPGLQAVKDLQNELDSLSLGCAAIDSALAANKTSSLEFFHESEGLEHELERNQQRCLLVQKFFDQYQLTPSEITALQVT